MNVRALLFNIVEPANEMIRSGVVCSNVEMVSVNVQLSI